mmetsp:Transcript_3227/g.6984  ORF Transcript_3227/g.6984 Transcript_3227/m.6984 type:complete len:203 (+) Transcript_3227:1507-2115(+)
MAYGPLCVPIAFRCSGCSKVAVTGPLTAGSAAPQTTGRGLAEYCRGCVVSTTQRCGPLTFWANSLPLVVSFRGSLARLGRGSRLVSSGPVLMPRLLGDRATFACDSMDAARGTKRSGRSMVSTISMPAALTAHALSVLLETNLSIRETPIQRRTSGMSSWSLASSAPPTSLCCSKKLSTESPCFLRALCTRNLLTSPSALPS